MKLLGLLVVCFGGLCFVLAGYLFWQRINPERLMFRGTASEELRMKNFTRIRPLPIRIVVPKVRIDVAIYPAAISKKGWETTDKGASYLLSTPLPGEVGNSVIYGHDFDSIFGRLSQVKPKNEVVIYFSDGTLRKFEVSRTQVVSPSETTVLAQNGGPKLTIYTCTGFLDSERFVAVATLR